PEKGARPSRLGTIFRRLFDPGISGHLSLDLLLLPQGVLPRLLAGPSRLCGRRGAKIVLGREPLAAPVPEHPSLCSVFRALLPRHALLGRDSGILLLAAH